MSLEQPMFDPFAAVLEFHRRFGVLIGDRPAIADPSVASLRLTLIEEELAELREAIGSTDIVSVADALADLLYVIYGAAISFGIDIRPIFEEVHRTNMTKLGGTTREDGKILKPEGWERPNLESVLEHMRLTE
jgi:predicted HAD superfamily Cof-like phosphohydrolase